MGGAPVPQRPRLAGGLAFWLAVNVAAALAIVALARPQALASITETAGVDFVVLQDGSTSMRVADVAPDRWQRSVAWIRTFAEVLGWRRERVALALFAHRAAPQVRLTRDPNALFFFSRSPGRRAAVPAAGRHELEHQHRGRHRLGRPHGREGRGAVRARG